MNIKNIIEWQSLVVMQSSFYYIAHFSLTSKNPTHRSTWTESMQTALPVKAEICWQSSCYSVYHCYRFVTFGFLLILTQAQTAQTYNRGQSPFSMHFGFLVFLDHKHITICWYFGIAICGSNNSNELHQVWQPAALPHHF